MNTNKLWIADELIEFMRAEKPDFPATAFYSEDIVSDLVNAIISLLNFPGGMYAPALERKALDAINRTGVDDKMKGEVVPLKRKEEK